MVEATGLRVSSLLKNNFFISQWYDLLLCPTPADGRLTGRSHLWFDRQPLRIKLAYKLGLYSLF
jgi:hypothetical protein